MFITVETPLRYGCSFKVVTEFRILYFMILVKQFASLRRVYARPYTGKFLLLQYSGECICHNSVTEVRLTRYFLIFTNLNSNVTSWRCPRKLNSFATVTQSRCSSLCKKLALLLLVSLLLLLLLVNHFLSWSR